MSELSYPDGATDISVPLAVITSKLLIISVVMLVVPLALFKLVWADVALFASLERLAFVGWLIALTMLHELVHATSWKLLGGLRWADIEFGVKWKYLAPYAHSKAPMRASAYRIGAVMPLLLVGLLPFGVALALGDGLWAWLGAVMISGAVGDVTVLWVMRSVASDALVIDHPENAGCLVLPEPTTS